MRRTIEGAALLLVGRAKLDTVYKFCLSLGLPVTLGVLIGLDAW